MVHLSLALWSRNHLKSHTMSGWNISSRLAEVDSDFFYSVGMHMCCQLKDWIMHCSIAHNSFCFMKPLQWTLAIPFSPCSCTCQLVDPPPQTWTCITRPDNILKDRRPSYQFPYLRSSPSVWNRAHCLPHCHKEYYRDLSVHKTI